MELRDRFLGSLVGLAVGDALGVPFEGRDPGEFPTVTDMSPVPGQSFPRGTWSDDTSLALCLAESLSEKGSFDARDQMDRYLRWLKDGYLSCSGPGFGLGITTAEALQRYARTGEPFSGPTDPKKAGNGCIMRLAPVSLFFSADPMLAVENSGQSSRTTHGALTCIDACRYFGGLIVGAALGHPKDVLLSDHYSPAPGCWREGPLVEEIDEVASGSFLRKQPPEIEGSGYVVRSLEAALWAFATTGSYREGCLKSVNLGGDTDTTAAIFGQLAGAYYGVGGIPAEWISMLEKRDIVEGLASRLFDARYQPR